LDSLLFMLSFAFQFNFTPVKNHFLLQIACQTQQFDDCRNE
jgi:hypothetical protein